MPKKCINEKITIDTKSMNHKKREKFQAQMFLTIISVCFLICFLGSWLQICLFGFPSANLECAFCCRIEHGSE